MNKYIFLFFLALGIASLACTKITPTPNPTGEIHTALGVRSTNPTQAAEIEIPTPTPSVSALGIVGNVYIRNSPNAAGLIVGSLGVGESLAGVCFGDWCAVGNGYVWRGCTSDNPNGLGCSEAK